jgi:enterochelin esterase-like enzyme
MVFQGMEYRVGRMSKLNSLAGQELGEIVILRFVKYRKTTFLLLFTVAFCCMTSCCGMDPEAITVPTASETEKNSTVTNQVQTPVISTTAALPAARPTTTDVSTPIPLEMQNTDAQWISQNLNVESGTLEYHLYLPPGYAPEKQTYPLLMLLHGFNGNSKVWETLGLVQQLNQLITEGEIAPLIVAVPSFPDLSLDPSDQEAQKDLQTLYEHLLTTYPIMPEREAHAIGGYSIGATWAFYLAANYPDAWGRLGMHSQSMAYEQGYGLAEKMRASGLEYAIWMDIGKEDAALPAVTSLHQILEVSNLKHQFLINPGGHTSSYWREHLGDYLRWYAENW